MADRPARAIVAWKKAIAIKPDFAEAYNNMGWAYAALEEYREALTAFKKTISIEPAGIHNAYSGMGYAHYKPKQYPQAITAYKKSLAIKPDEAWEYLNMGKARQGLKQYPEGIAAFENVIALEPNSIPSDSAREHISEIENRLRL